MTIKFQISFLFSFILLQFLYAQELTQTIRGTVVDKITQMPLPGANVVVINSTPFNGASTDLDGKFKISHVPVGNHSLKISFLGYKELTLPNVVVNSGKEVVLNINVEENIIQGAEVVVTGKLEKNKAINEYSVISARTFSVEETQKYAAAVNDPARMATAYAGVISTNDGNNTIAIRGNSPNGLQWRMEGVEIPNPNHFSNVGTSGGGISILSSQLLTNSDFLTGAFSAEYGNALSGVFDLRLRKGNNQKREYTIQAGILGTDVAAEGPFKKGYDGSYLVNYRYSTLSLLDKIGVNIGFGTTTFQDLSYNIYLPTKVSGSFTLFGFGGLSSQVYKAEKDSAQWTDYFHRISSKFHANTGASGITHFLTITSSTYLKTSLIASGTSNGYTDDLINEEYQTEHLGDQDLNQHKVSLSSVLTKKVNSRLSLKAGITGNKINYTFFKRYKNDETDKVETYINEGGSAYTFQSFFQASYHTTEKLTLNGGVHFLMLATNGTYAVEPRISVKYELNPAEFISLGYGLHSQVQPLGVYYVQRTNANGVKEKPNKNLGFTKAQHLVLAYDKSLSEFLHLKLEGYYQYLYNIPVSTDPTSTYSVVNQEEGYSAELLTNKGTGRNVGIELTFEQFLRKDLYFLLSGSIFDSKYKAANGEWYNTRFNSNYNISFTAGKEVKTGEKFRNRILGFNLKSVYSGGLRETPINEIASVANGYAVQYEERAFENKVKDYFRTDIRLSVKRNRIKSTVTWALDIQNVGNHKNAYGKYFDPQLGKIQSWYQAPLIPILSYKVDF
ncbi:carboxypeptidase-like regulatory domain-containing protein [soil metagenome]